MKTLSIWKAIISAIIAWLIGVAAYIGSYFVPVMDNPDVQSGWVLTIALIPATFIGAHIYYQRVYSTNGFLLGSFMFLITILLDAAITVPLFIIPNGGSHLRFFADPVFWLIGLEYVTMVTAYWLIRKTIRAKSIIENSN